jgi:hypothetical protein
MEFLSRSVSVTVTLKPSRHTSIDLRALPQPSIFRHPIAMHGVALSLP